jgi:hypothetical protein
MAMGFADAYEAVSDTVNPGLSLSDVVKIAGIASQGQQQMPAYQSFVPPQSMVMQPPPRRSGAPTGMTQMQSSQRPQSIMSQAARQKLAQERADSGMGGILGTLAGAGIGLLAGGPAGALTGAKLGKSILG